MYIELNAATGLQFKSTNIFKQNNILALNIISAVTY